MGKPKAGAPKKRTYDEVPFGVKLLTAGTAGCLADLVAFPLDTAKVRLQVQGESMDGASSKAGSPQYKGVYHTIRTMAKTEGPRSLYNGLAAGLQRQMCFASVRIGMYDTVKSFYQKTLNGDKEPSGWLDIVTRISAGITTGALAVLVAQPTDVVKVRFQAQTGKKKRYKSTFEAYSLIYKSEGVSGLWKGMFPNIGRNAIVNVSEIVCYDLVKAAILRNNIMDDNTLCHFTSAVIAGFITTVVSSPVDVIKTRYMNSRPGQYKNAVDCTIKTAKLEGFPAFYKGFTPSFYRLVVWNIVMWVSYEKLKLFAVYALN